MGNCSSSRQNKTSTSQAQNADSRGTPQARPRARLRAMPRGLPPKPKPSQSQPSTITDVSNGSIASNTAVGTPAEDIAVQQIHTQQSHVAAQKEEGVDLDLDVSLEEEPWTDPDSFDPLDPRGKTVADQSPKNSGCTETPDTLDERKPALRTMGFKLDQYIEIIVGRLELDELQDLTPHVIKQVATLTVNDKTMEDGPPVFAAQLVLHDLAECWILFRAAINPKPEILPKLAEMLASDVQDHVNYYKAIHKTRMARDRDEEMLARRELDNMKMRKWRQSIARHDKLDDTWASNACYFCKWRSPRDPEYEGQWRKEMRENVIKRGLMKFWKEHRIGPPTNEE